MKYSLLLSEADVLRLHSILDDTDRGPKATPVQKKSLETILAACKIPTVDSLLESRVGFDDGVSLVSPADSRDFYNLYLVMPRDEDIDADRISILQPVCMAVIGRRCGENVAWDTSSGRREMRIIAVRKAAHGMTV